MSRITRIAAVTALLSWAGASTAADFDAQTYHDGNCMRCHDTGVYTREDRRVGSYERLEAQVARCDANFGSKLFPEDLDMLVAYLNSNFYKFEK